MKFSLTKALQELDQKIGTFKYPIIAMMFYFALTSEKVSQLTAMLITIFIYVVPCIILIWEHERGKKKESEEK